MKCSAALRFLTLLAGASMATTVFPIALTGIVDDPTGKPIANVFVTAEDGARKMAVSVLTDRVGHYQIDDLFPGRYQLRARKAGFADSVAAPVALDVSDAAVDLKLQPDDAVHFSTPGAAWLNVLPKSQMKATFITQCTICHDQGSPLAHVPRDAKGWESIITQMRNQNESYASLVTKDNGPLANWLAEQKYGTQLASFDPFTARANVATTARITEYSLGGVNSWAHDVVIEPSTGTAWVGDYIQDVLTSINPRTGAQKAYPAPLHGTGMHSLSFDRDGNLWITLQMVAKVARFNTKNGEWRVYDGFSPGSLNHSFALDSEGFVKKDPSGRLYVSLWGGNHTALLDPNTGELKTIQLPGNPADKPYGISVDSKGLIWYTKYSENMLGFVDPATGQGKEWALPRPQSGPHRMHIDNDDNLWIPLSGYGTILRYNTRDGSQKEYPLPDADTFPYSARYDSKSDRVWVTGNGGNAIYVFDPKTAKFTTFRMPSALSYGRMVSIDYSTGDVWTGLASYPNKLSLRDHSVVVRIHHALDLVH
jgi:virginiamycin B lyase